MLDFEVVPEHSLLSENLHFILGQPLHQTVSVLQQNDSVVKSVQLLFNDQNPYNSELILNLVNDGVQLIFDGVTQRLKVIEVLLAKVKLRYQGVYFNFPEQIPPTLDQIDRCFGATHPGLYDEEKQTFILTFRGLSFMFHLPRKAETNYHQGICSLQFPSDAAPVVQRMQLYSGKDVKDAHVPAMPLCCFYGNCYTETAVVDRRFTSQGVLGISLGVTLKAISQSEDESLRFSDRICKHFEATVRFGDSVQDVLSALGSPGDIYYKSADRAKFNENAGVTAPVTRGAQPLIRQRSGDGDLQVESLGESTDTGFSHYFYNYFTYGLDVLFDGRTNRAVKFVLHCNMPGHYDFNQYYRCEFSLPLTPECTVTTGSRWSAISSQLAALGHTVTRPVVLHRQGTYSSTRSPSDIAQAGNPGPVPTLCFAFGDIIFEVMQNDYIATVTICSNNSTETSNVSS